jgi:hypothetical protein
VKERQMKERKCGCKKSRVATVYCDKHATEQLENAARNLEENPARYYFRKSMINALSIQQEKEQEEE